MPRTSRNFLTLAAVALLVATAGCRSVPTDDDNPRLPSVTGVISLEGETSIPANAVLAVRLVDLGKTDASRVIVEQIISSPDKFPFRYRLLYHPGTIDYARDYGVETSVNQNGRPIWTQSDSNPVLTKDRPVVANIVLHRAK